MYIKCNRMLRYRTVPRCYKQDSWSNESVARQSSAGKNVNIESKNIVGIHHQVTGEDTAN
jgi:hypothetical protein